MTARNSEELARLLPCPFCGEPATLNDYTDKPVGAWVLAHKVNGCIIRIVESYNRPEYAIARWNTRTPDPTLAARVLELEAAQQWQPIESAPRDGTCVILWVIEDHDGKGHMLWPCNVIHGDWCWEISDNRNLDYDYEIIEQCKPTHWMPLPAPPRAALRQTVTKEGE